MYRPSNFVGRARQLAQLSAHLNWVAGGGVDQRGRCVLVRGRRRVGKSRLVEVFCGLSGVDSFWFSCTRNEHPAQERAQFVSELAGSSLSSAHVVGDDVPATWHIAFRRLADALDDHQPTIVVIDEIPWLAEQDAAAEGALQTVWDRYLSRKPVLLILIGSDLAVMEQLTAYGRPFHQRGVEMVLDPLNPAEVADMLSLPAADALDAFLITGGLPMVCQEWPRAATMESFLEQSFADATSALLVSGERSLASEFPNESRARAVLGIVGSGERTFTRISERLGAGTAVAPSTASGALALLVEKRVVRAAEPLSLKVASTDRRYSIADPYLRFWLRFVAPAMTEVERGRTDLPLLRVERGWSAWRGRAIEPVVRDSLGRLLPDDRFPNARAIGGWWNRSNNPEVDLVAADATAKATTLSFIGSIKWRDSAPFDGADFGALARVARAVPGCCDDTALVAVSRSGDRSSALAASWGPDDLLSAWRRPPVEPRL